MAPYRYTICHPSWTEAVTFNATSASQSTGPSMLGTVTFAHQSSSVSADVSSNESELRFRTSQTEPSLTIPNLARESCYPVRVALSDGVAQAEIVAASECTTQHNDCISKHEDVVTRSECVKDALPRVSADAPTPQTDHEISPSTNEDSTPRATATTGVSEREDDVPKSFRGEATTDEVVEVEKYLQDNEEGPRPKRTPLSFLNLPAEARVRIYRYLFPVRETLAFTYSLVYQQVRVRHGRLSGFGLCFTCKDIESESRCIAYSMLHWRIKEKSAFDWVLRNPRYHNDLITWITLPANGNAAMLNTLLRPENSFTKLIGVFLDTSGRLLTPNAPHLTEWPDLIECLKAWDGFPSDFKDINSDAPRRLSISLRVDCLYKPYMKGKQKYWHDSRKSRFWCSTWKINIFAESLSRVANLKTREHHMGRRRLLVTVREFEERAEVMRFAGLDGNPFKRL